MAVFYNGLRFHLSYLTMLPPEKCRFFMGFDSFVRINPDAKGLNALLASPFRFAFSMCVVIVGKATSQWTI